MNLAAQLEFLAQRISSAISCLKNNDLQGFESLIAEQERVCVTLRETFTQPQPVAAKDATSEKVYSAFRALAKTNRLYAEVLRRSKISNDLISLLYGGYEQGYKTPSLEASISLRGSSWEA
jgi:hypothetical protein